MCITQFRIWFFLTDHILLKIRFQFLSGDKIKLSMEYKEFEESRMCRIYFRSIECLSTISMLWHEIKSGLSSFRVAQFMDFAVCDNFCWMILQSLLMADTKILALLPVIPLKIAQDLNFSLYWHYFSQRLKNDPNSFNFISAQNKFKTNNFSNVSLPFSLLMNEIANHLTKKL